MYNKIRWLIKNKQHNLKKVIKHLTNKNECYIIKELVIRPHGQAVKTPPFHGGIPGSNPGGVTIIFENIISLTIKFIKS